MPESQNSKARRQDVLMAHEVEMSNINLSTPSKMQNGGSMIYINNKKNSLLIQTPNVDVLWDSKYYADDGDNGKYTVQFSLSDIENDKRMCEFHDRMLELDKYILDMAFENRKEWFGAKFSKVSEETIENLYTHMVKVSVDQETGEPNGKFPPRFAFKVVKRDGKHLCKVYNSERDMYKIDDPNVEDYVSLETDVLVKGTNMTAVLKCNGIWVINGKFGCTWRAEQLMVKVQEKSVGDWAFRDDDDEAVADTTPTPVEDSDDSDNDETNETENVNTDEVEVAAAEPVTATPKKKVTRKVKKVQQSV